MMDNTLVKFESLSGLTVELTPETVKNTLTRGNGKVTDQEVAMFIRTCQAKKLDPLENGEVYLIKYSDAAPAQLVVGYHAYNRRAERYPDYRGKKSGITVLRNGEVVQKEGYCVYKALKEELIGGWCRVFRERSPGKVEEHFVEVSIDEYSTGQSNWKAKPSTMIHKVAVCQALRDAYPNEYEGIYSADEMVASGAIEAGFTELPDEPATMVSSNPTPETTVAERVISQEERQGLFTFSKESFGDKKKGNDALKLVIEELGLESTTTMHVSQLNTAKERIKELSEIAKAEAAKVDPGEENVEG